MLSVDTDPTWRELALLQGLLVAFAGRILLKDFRDAAGDALFGKWTFLLRHGRLATCRVSAACWIVGTASVVAALPSVGARPGVAVVAVAGACLVCALHGVAQLVTETDPVGEEVVIGAIVMAGRGLVAAYVATLAARGLVAVIRPY